MPAKKETSDTIRLSVLNWIQSKSPDCNFPHENWGPLLLASSLDEESDLVKVIISKGANCDRSSSGCTSLLLTPLHIAASKNRMDTVDQLISLSCEVNAQDQMGFTALHYAVLKRNGEIIQKLISAGASINLSSAAGSTPLDLASELKFHEIEDILSTQLKGEMDPLIPKFKSWLSHLGAAEYISKFINAGYDLSFIARAGLVEADLDCVGIPMSKLGIRKKILALHDISDFFIDPNRAEVSVNEDNDDEEESEDGSISGSEES